MNSEHITHLHPVIARNLQAIGYGQPRPIQARTLDPVLAGRDLIGLAKAGSGKTAAFLVPLAHLLITHRPGPAPSGQKKRPIGPSSRLRALVLCPTRELAQQVADEAAAIMQGSVLRTVAAYGKVARSPQAKAIARGVDLLVATPGRVRELLDDGALSLAYVRYVVIDEADRMLDMGFLPQVQSILATMPAEQRQTLLFSATMPPPIEELARQFLREPVRLELGRHTTPVGHIAQRLLPVDDRDKVPMLLHLLQDKSRRGVIVFCRTRRRVGWVGTALERNGISVGMLHGDRSQAQRQRALDRFANGELAVLVATDVASRGLHIPVVKLVINYDLPMSPEEYVHRIGRAGHGEEDSAGAEQRSGGEALTFLSDDDRLRWRAVLNVAGVEVYAEALEGFEPRIKVRKVTQQRSSHAAPVRDRGSRKPSRSRRPRLSRKSRPIKTGQRPGQGVRRPQA